MNEIHEELCQIFTLSNGPYDIRLIDEDDQATLDNGHVGTAESLARMLDFARDKHPRWTHIEVDYINCGFPDLLWEVGFKPTKGQKAILKLR